jgi:hypothetical protein
MAFNSSHAGQPFGGGYYAGANIMVGGVEYAVVVAPKSQGGEASSGLQWKITTTPTTGTDSSSDSVANTLAMTSYHPAAQFCNNLSINGYTDWVLPAKNVLEVCYRYLKPSSQSNDTSYGANGSSVPTTSDYTSTVPSQTNIQVFEGGGSEAFEGTHYWSSTQFSSPFAWYQSFSSGRQYPRDKSRTYRVRAVRLVEV